VPAAQSQKFVSNCAFEPRRTKHIEAPLTEKIRDCCSDAR